MPWTIVIRSGDQRTVVGTPQTYPSRKEAAKMLSLFGKVFIEKDRHNQTYTVMR